MMKKITSVLSLMIFALTFAGISNLSAQQYKLIQQEKIAFFSKRIGLTPDEAKLFWPLYDEYQAKKEKLNNERKATVKYYAENAESLTPTELENITNRYVGFQKKETDLLEFYTAEFKKILPIEKVLKVYITEIEFRRYLIELLRDKQIGQGLRNNR